MNYEEIRFQIIQSLIHVHPDWPIKEILKAARKLAKYCGAV